MNTHTQELSDEELVTGARSNKTPDLELFDELIGRHYGRVLATCRAMTRFSADSEDLAQEVLVKTLFALTQFRRSLDVQDLDAQD